MCRCVVYGAFAICASLLISCHRNSQGYENITAAPDQHPPHDFEGMPSYYDTIAPAVLQVNDVHLYDSFASLMQFSDQMPSDSSIRGLHASFFVDSTGVMIRTDRVHATERKEEFDRAYKYLLNQMTWTPAYLKRDPKKKTWDLVSLVIRVDKDSVKLDMHGGSQYLYKRYARPMVH